MLASHVARASAKGRSEEPGLPNHPPGETEVCPGTFDRLSLWGGISLDLLRSASSANARTVSPESKGGWTFSEKIRRIL